MGQDTSEPRRRRAHRIHDLTMSGMAASLVFDLSPIDLEVDLAEALTRTGERGQRTYDSTGFDREFRAFEAEEGKQEILDMVLPDQVTDPFERAMETGMDLVSEHSPFELSTHIPDIVMLMML